MTSEIATGLEKVTLGQLDAKGDRDKAGKQMSAVADKLLNDPKAASR